MKKNLLSLVVLICGLFAFKAHAATYTSTGNGLWTTTTNWSPVAPAGGPTWNDVVYIETNISLAGGTYNGSGTITIRNGGSLSITGTGNLTISGSSTKLIVGTVSTSGSLSVPGTFTMDNAATFTMTAGTANVATMALTGGKFVGNGGTTTVTTGGLTADSGGGTAFSNNSGSTFIVNTGSNTGAVSVAKFTNGGTFNVVNVANFSFTNNGGTFSNTGTMSIGGALSQYSTFNNSGSITVSGAATNSGGTITQSGTLTVGGLLTTTSTFDNSGTTTVGALTTNNSGGTFTNTGTVTSAGDANISGSVQLSPSASASSRMTIQGTFYLKGSGLIVGNGSPGTPARYADLAIWGNVAQTSHDITVKCNGRVAIFGDLNLSSGGGLNFTINNCGSSGGVPIGGQVYVNGDGSGNSVTNTSSGGAVNNNNPNFGTPSTPYGFYVNGTVSSGVDSDNATVAQMQSTNPTFYSWVASLPNSPLPVKISYFKITAVREGGITLEWATSMEKNFNYFEVQRSGADLNFTTIDIVQGKGGLEVKTVYTVLDDAPANGKNYYRLKAVDLDNTFEYFNVIVADWSGSDNGATLYPNPAIDRSFTIDIGDGYDQPVDVTVYEVKGYVIYSTTVNTRTTTVQLPDNISTGIYLVRVSSHSKQQLIRLAVR